VKCRVGEISLGICIERLRAEKEGRGEENKKAERRERGAYDT
jgi:hypothetical protein